MVQFWNVCDSASVTALIAHQDVGINGVESQLDFVVVLIYLNTTCRILFYFECKHKSFVDQDVVE